LQPIHCDFDVRSVGMGIPLDHCERLVSAYPLDRRKIDVSLDKMRDRGVPKRVSDDLGQVEPGGLNDTPKRLPNVHRVAKFHRVALSSNRGRE